MAAASDANDTKDPDESKVSAASSGDASPGQAAEVDAAASPPPPQAAEPAAEELAVSHDNSGKQFIYVPNYKIVRVGDDDVHVDVNACASQVSAFAALIVAKPDPDGDVMGQDGYKKPDLYFPDFPGGVECLRSVVKLLEATAAEERAASAAEGGLGVPKGVLKVNRGAFALDYNTDNICNYLEAAAKLRCPKLLRDTVLAPAAKELSSRRVLALLERVVQFTAAFDADCGESPLLSVSSFDEGGGRSAASEDLALAAAAAAGEEAAAGACPRTPTGLGGGDAGSSAGLESTNREQVAQAFCQVIQRLCARLDAVDFKLSAALAAGGPWASKEVLRAYRVKVENLGRVNYALQSVTSTVKSFFYEEEVSTQKHKQEWKEHHFALHVFRKHIIESTLSSSDKSVREMAEAAMSEQHDVVEWSDDEQEGAADPHKQTLGEDQAEIGENDIPEAICDCGRDSALRSLAGLVLYVDPSQTPPVLAAAMVRSLVVVGQVDRAKSLFEAVFVRSKKVQAMITVRTIPVDFLSSVKQHRVASAVLRRLLARYESLSCAELCHILGHILLEDFRNEKHCLELVLSNALIQDIVVYCRVNSRAVAALESSAGDPDGAVCTVPGTSGNADLLRLRKVGEQLFAAVFSIHNGFLPLKEDDPEFRHSSDAGPWGIAECPWDSGDLDLPLLQHVPNNSEALHLSRCVLLRGLFRRQHAGVESDVPSTVRLWSLGRWPACRDAALISEAFSFLSLCWRGLRSTKAEARWEDRACAAAADWLRDEESLFGMFADLEFWRLQPRELLTPWVPQQLLACHLASRCKLLDEQQRTLFADNLNNLREINSLRHLVSQLHAKLEQVDARSVHSIQKQSEVQDTLRTLR